MKLKLDSPKEYELVVTGDVSGDGNITATDLLKIKRAIVKLNNLEGAYGKAADLDENSKITATDLLKIKRAIVKL